MATLGGSDVGVGSEDYGSMTFKDKKRFFEREIEERSSCEYKPKEARKFSFLQEHEVQQLKNAVGNTVNAVESEIDNTTDFSVLISSLKLSRHPSDRSAMSRLCCKAPRRPTLVDQENTQSGDTSAMQNDFVRTQANTT